MFVQTMPLSQVLLILRSRWRTVLGIWFTLVALTLAFSLLWPPRYNATAGVVVDVQSPDPLGGTVLGGGLISSYIATQVDMLRSERVVRRAIRMTSLADDEEYREAWLKRTEGRGDYESWLVDEVLEDYSVKPSRGSNALTIAYTSKYPERAAAMANAIVQAYIDVSLELRTVPAREYNQFFDQRALELRANLERAQNRLSAFQQKTGILANDERFDVETLRLNELTSQVLTLQNAANEAAGRRRQAVANAEYLPEVQSHPVVAQLTSEIAAQRARLEELGERLGDNHPRVREANAQLAELDRRLRTATRQASMTTEVGSNVAKGRLDSAAADLREQRVKVLKLKAQRDEAAVLQRDVENAQRAYDLTMSRMSETAMESQVRSTNVSVIREASVPPIQSFPRPKLMTAAAFVLGFFLAVAAAMLREFMDQRLRTEYDVAHALAQPMLVRIPKRNPQGSTTSRQLALKQRVLSGLARPMLKGA